MLNKVNPKQVLAKRFLPTLWGWFFKDADGATIIQNSEDPRATLAKTKKDRENHGIRVKLGSVEDFYRTRCVGVRPMQLFGTPLWLAYNEGDGVASLPGARALKEVHEEYEDVSSWEELEALFEGTGEERVRPAVRDELPEDVVEILELAMHDPAVLTREDIERVDEVIPLPVIDEDSGLNTGEKLKIVARDLLGKEKGAETDGGSNKTISVEAVESTARERVMRDVKGSVEIPNKSVVNLEWLGFLPTHNGDRHDIHRAEQNAIISQWKQLAKQKGSEWIRYLVFMVLGAVIATQFGGGGGSGFGIPLPF
jgi:hypothetical protein